MLIPFKGNYIAGVFKDIKDPVGSFQIKSPADTKTLVTEMTYSYSSVDEAVAAARGAFKAWKKTSFNERVKYLLKYKEALKRNEEGLSKAISLEIGKPLWESKQEVATMINKVDVSISDGMKQVTDYELPGIVENTNGVCRYRPYGVFVVLGPFNFPGHLANGHIVPALATGNTVIFKPSEKSPVVGQIVAECFHEAGLPEGVFNLVQGEKEVGRRLSIHEGIDGVLFTGSYEVGLKIKQDTLHQYWKNIALEMGGKNAAIIFEDADLDWAVYETLTGAFITTGQRCSATSRIFVHQSKIDEFISKFHERAKNFAIGHPFENPFMGPLVDENAVDKYQKFLGIAQREDCEMLMRGKRLDLEHQGYYVSPSICLVKNNTLAAAKKSVYLQNEIFGPNVAITAFDTLDQAVDLANSTQFGLVTSLFTSNKEKYLKASEELYSGLVNWNRGTVGASSRLPFGGLRKSGNHLPTAVSAANACVYPVASLEVNQTKAVNSTMPGLNWK